MCPYAVCVCVHLSTQRQGLVIGTPAFYCDDILLEYWTEDRSHGLKVPPVLLSPLPFSPVFPNLFPIEELPK
jgi:hypothetical protein